MLFRLIGSSTKTESQALAPTTVILLLLILYTGFAIPFRYMLGWAKWMKWINPVSYAFESLLVNELHGREFTCSNLVPSGPSYDSVDLLSRTCNVIGSVAGSRLVSGDRYMAESYGYSNAHKWRNFGILLGFMIFFMACTLITSELVASARSKGEVLVFRRGHTPATLSKDHPDDVENGTRQTRRNKQTQNDGGTEAKMAKQTSIFHWRNVCYDVQIKTETRRILDHVDGWVKPGTLTALMVSLCAFS